MFTKYVEHMVTITIQFTIRNIINYPQNMEKKVDQVDAKEEMLRDSSCYDLRFPH